jgi:hypothetical protein
MELKAFLLLTFADLFISHSVDELKVGRFRPFSLHQPRGCCKEKGRNRLKNISQMLIKN